MPEKKSKLFEREGDDIVYQSGTSKNGFRTTVYKHSNSKMRVILCRVPGPLCSMFIHVPTVSTNSKGLPHTLEHLVFCGSERYPNRGYLDALSICNFSTGTNAWTADDHTCYTLTTAGEEAIANVLPVFLDHILHPLLRDDQFITEVYHFDSEGKEQGVVFSEMVSRETDEGDLADLHLKRLMYSSKSTYVHECGGLTKEISKLTNQEIIEYHKKFYDSNNLTVLLVGSFSDDFDDVIQSIPEEIIESNGSDSRQHIDCGAPGSTLSEHVQFPSSDTSVGSICFGWRGPPIEDDVTNEAIEILMEYLAGTGSSPLCQRFIERPCPLANYVYTDVRDSVPVCTMMYFSGVPNVNGGSNDELDSDDNDESDGDDDYLSAYSEAGEAEEEEDDKDLPNLYQEGYFKKLLIEELQRLYDTKFDGNPGAIRDTCKRYRQKVVVGMENHTHETIQKLVCSNVISCHFSPTNRDSSKFNGMYSNMFDIIDELSNRPIEYWLDLLKRFIDEPVYHVVMVPNVSLNDELKEERQEIEKSNRDSITDKEKHTRIINNAIESNKVDISDELKRSVKIPDLNLINNLPHTLSLIELADDNSLTSVVQLVELDSDFSMIRLHMQLSSLPEELRPYLVIFQELLLATDILLPAGLCYNEETSPCSSERRIDYVTVDSQLANVTVTNSAAVGYRNERFACGWLDDLFNIYMRTSSSKFKTAARWMIQVLMFSDFTAERILTTAQNLMSELSELKRYADPMVSAITTRFGTQNPANGPKWIDNHISIFAQEMVLKQVIVDVKNNNADKIISSLRQLQNFLVYETGGFLTLGVPNGRSKQQYIDDFANEWSVCLDKFADKCGQGYTHKIKKTATEQAPAHLSKRLPDPFPLSRAIRFPDLDKPLNIHVTLPSLQSSCAQICFKCDLVNTPSGNGDFEQELAELPALDHYSLTLLTVLISRTDGPLYNSIRGKGYAYTTYFQLYSWSGTLVFECSRAADAPKAILEMRDLLREIDTNWHDYITEFEMNMARSTIVYENATTKSTPRSILDCCAVGNIAGFESTQQSDSWRNVHISAVTQDTIRSAFDKYLKCFSDPEYPALTVVLTPPNTDLPSELGEFESKTLDELKY